MTTFRIQMDITSLGDVFGLTNAPMNFMSLMNGVFKSFFDSFMIVFIETF